VVTAALNADAECSQTRGGLFIRELRDKLRYLRSRIFDGATCPVCGLPLSLRRIVVWPDNLLFGPLLRMKSKCS
jgi:hypothetical protein